MQFYVHQQLSKNRAITPEGYLLIIGTPLARTGIQLYGPDETPIKGVDKNGIVKIERNEDQVFRPQTIASANGKSLVNDHPEEDVLPSNWRELTMGVVLNPRRGEGDEDDLLTGDILVTTQDGIDLVNDGKVELSCGYEAKYEELAPGHGRQYDILINHVALVDNGRCGTRCSIRDTAMAKKTTVWDRLMKSVGVKDEAELKEKLSGVMDGEGDMPEDGEEHQHIHIHMPEAGSVIGDEGKKGPNGEDIVSDAKPSWFKDFEGKYEKDMASVRDSIAAVSKDKAKDDEGEEMSEEMADEVPEEVKEEAKKAKDSAYLGESFQETAAMAEIIAPGISIPTYDRKLSPAKTMDSICALRSRALDLAYHQPETRGMMDDLLGGKPFNPKMPCKDAKAMFRAVGAFKRNANNAGRARDNEGRRETTQLKTLRTPADLNEYYRNFYANH